MTKLHALLCSVELLLIIVILFHVPFSFVDTFGPEIKEIKDQLLAQLTEKN